eukprot:CAMPEP_0113546088 /NCGR_PEP_ID=MMETSP0015_2-20120614/11616_1 /TAXON_ID=2838 /ORGANISM="Odontella" /LENGTH=1827 /DNA_ID=CAMNT_0000446513 /DNA_START=106 /DNA_END=5586 /DNA_ORIENTATION=- /assembly_acc=CAM_ASM_000160
MGMPSFPSSGGRLRSFRRQQKRRFRCCQFLASSPMLAFLMLAAAISEVLGYPSNGSISFRPAGASYSASRSRRRRKVPALHLHFRYASLRLRGGGGTDDETDNNNSENEKDSGDEINNSAKDGLASESSGEAPIGEHDTPQSSEKKKSRTPYSLSGHVRDDSDDDEVIPLAGNDLQEEPISSDSSSASTPSDDEEQELIAEEVEQVASCSDGATDKGNDESGLSDCQDGNDSVPGAPVPECEGDISTLDKESAESMTEAWEDISDDDDDVRSPRTRQALLGDGVRRILSLVGRDDSMLNADEGCREHDESLRLRDGIVQRCEDYLEDVFPYTTETEDQPAVAWPLPHPKKVLHRVAPRIPAIRQSRDITLRITSARADVDAGAAARAIGAVAALAEMHDRIVLARSQIGDETYEELASLALGDIVSDRRFEQLVECVLCGLDLKRTSRLELSMIEDESRDSSTEEDSEQNTIDKEEIEQASIDLPSENDTPAIDKVDTFMETQMTMTDISVAAWGLGVLAPNQSKKFGGRIFRDIFIALCITSADLLMHRLESLRRGEACTPFGFEDGSGDSSTERTQLALLSHEMTSLVSDAALALWAFACARACTGFSSPCWDHHVDVCCAVLSTDEQALLEERASMLPDDDIVVERLEQAEDEETSAKSREYINIDDVLKEKEDLLLQQDGEDILPDENTTDTSEASVTPTHAETESLNAVDSEQVQGADEINTSNPDFVDAQKKSSLLLEKITPSEVANVFWALALPGLGKDVRGRSSLTVAPILSSSPQKQEVIGSLVNRVSELLRLDVAALWRLKASVTESSEVEEVSGDYEMNDDTETEGDDGSADESSDPNATSSTEIHPGENAIENAGYSDDKQLDEPNTATGEQISQECGEIEDDSGLLQEVEVFQDGDDRLEVIDASKFLAADTSDTSKSEEVEVDWDVETLQEGEETLEVVDASKLLAATEPSKVIDEYDIEAGTSEADTEDHNMPPSLEDLPEEESRCYNSDLLQGRDADDCVASDISDEGTSNSSIASYAHSPAMEFSPAFPLRDLSSIVWALTELRHPSRSKFLALVAVIASLLGRDAIMELGGGALSNLAWAFAKDLERQDDESAKSVEMPPSLPSVIQWIAESALNHMSITNASGAKGQDGFGAFEPPELSRLVWALSMISTTGRPFSVEYSQHDQPLRDLACAALHLAGSHISDFTAEDLARIVWAYTEYCPTDSSSKSRECFGKLTSTIKASLLRWENGQCSNGSREVDETARDSVDETPIFGRPRLSLPFLDLLVSHDDDDVEETSSIRHYMQQQGSLPSLRDLTVDPSTLCKVAYGLSTLPAKQSLGLPQSFSGMSCLRIATRLFASKHGRLLRECNIRDLVRLCCACANTIGATRDNFSSADQEFVFRHFPRRVVQLLNENESLLGQLSASNLADLVWALGELGVQESRNAKNGETEYKKLRLAAKLPALSESQLEVVPPSCTLNLLCGLVQMGSNRSDLMISILQDFQKKVPSLQPTDLSRSVICLTKLLRYTTIVSDKSGLDSGETASAVTLSATSPRDETAKEDTTDTDMKQDGEIEVAEDSSKRTKHAKDEVVSGLQESEAEEVVIDNLSLDDQQMSRARNLCRESIQLVATEFQQNLILSQLPSFEIRRMLEALVLLPYQADALIDAVEMEIKSRMSTLKAANAMQDTRSIQMLLINATDSSVEAATTLSTLLSEGKSESNPFKKGLKALIDKKSGESESDSKHVAVAPDDLVAATKHVNSAAASLCEAVARIERADKGAMLDVEKMLHSAEGGTISELAQCQEWVAGYRRLDFATNSRTSRLDETRRKN